MKRFLSVILIAAMLVISVPLTFSVSAETVVVNSEAELVAAINADAKANIKLGQDFSVQKTITTDFKGVLDGDGKTITLTGNMLFKVSNGGTFKNLIVSGFVNATTTASDTKVAALLGEAGTSVTMEGVINKADVTNNVTGNIEMGIGYTAGLIGRISTGCAVDIQDCVNEGDIATICANGATVKQTIHTAGLFAYSRRAKGTITRCINKGGIVIDGAVSNAGGIIGHLEGNTTNVLTIEYCGNMGDINGLPQNDGNTLGNRGERSAGIVGYLQSSVIRYCYNTGMIYDDAAFGIAGYGNSNASSWHIEVYGNYTYSPKALSAEVGTARMNLINGGRYDVYGNYIMESRRELPNTSIETVDEYKDGSATGTKYYTSNSAVKGDHYIPASTYRNADHLLDMLSNDPALAGAYVADTRNINKGYPIFTWQTDASDAEEDDLQTVEVNSFAALAQALANENTVCDKVYKLTANITVPSNFTQIPAFYDVLDGNGYTITLDNTTSALIDVLYGTIKNVTFAGKADIKSYHATASTTEKGNATGGVYVAGTFANVTYGATFDHVVSNVATGATYTRTGTETIANTFGGFVGASLPNADGVGTLFTYCVNNGSVTVNFPSNKTFSRDMAGGLVGYMFGYTRVVYCRNNADVITSNSQGNSGCFAAMSLPNNSLTGGSKTGRVYVNYSVNTGDFKNTGASGERAAGFIGSAYGTEFTYCYNLGTKLSGNNKGFYGIHGWSRAYGPTPEHMTVFGCYTVSGVNALTQLNINSNDGFIYASNFIASGISENGTKSFTDNAYNSTKTTIVNKDGGNSNVANTTSLGASAYHYKASATFNDANDLTSKLAAEFATSGVYVKDTCGINNGYPILAWEAHDYVTLYEENEKNYVTTGKDLDCDKYNNAEFAGFVQFANDSNKVRFVMAIDADYLAEASTKYESFDVVITVNGDKTATVNSLTLSSYKEVTAGTDVYYADECEIFGFIMNFGDTVVSSLDFKIVIGEETFELGSYTAN